MRVRRGVTEILLPLALMVAMAAACRYDAPGMSAHVGGEISLVAVAVSLLTSVVLGIKALRKRRWLCAVMMAMVLLFSVGCDRWLYLHTPPCSECEPAEYAEWIEVTDKG